MGTFFCESQKKLQKLQKLEPAKINLLFSGILEKRRGRSSHVIWMGKVANKDRILAEAQLVCHSVQKIKPPFEM